MRLYIKQSLMLLPIFVFASFLFAVGPFLVQSPDSPGFQGFWYHFNDKGLRWMLLSFLVPGIIGLVRKFPLIKSDWLVSGVVHLAGSIVLAFTQLGLAFFLYEVLIRLRIVGFAQTSFSLFLGKNINMSLLSYWLIAGIVINIDSYKKFRDKEIVSLQLEAELAKAQMKSLQAQVEPHFLFNTLHAISGLVYKDPKAADAVLSRLSRLIRSTLDFSEEQEIPLDREIEILTLYLEIMQVRFGDRIRIEWDLAPETLPARVPSFLLQPLVENSFRHGILPKIEGGTVRIRARKADDRLVLTISDNGLGLAKVSPAASSAGLGLANISKRLEMLYRNQHEFRIDNGDGGGVVVAIALPFRVSRPEVVSEFQPKS